MPAPIDYTSQVASPFAQAVQGLQFGSGIAKIQQDRQAQELALQKQQKQSETMNALLSNPNPSASDYARATLAVPQMADQLKQSWGLHSEDEKKSSLSEISEVYSALQSGKPQIAADILNRRADALENSGGPEEQVDVARRMARMAVEAPDFARTQTGLQLAAIPGGDKIIEGAAKLSATYQKESLHPTAIKKAAADLGLTNAQAAKAAADAVRLGQESQKAVIELEALKKSGGIDPDKKFAKEKDLRTEYVKRVAGFIESQRVFDNMKESAKGGGPGDVALITSFMKMLDPGSVVRESEFATARDTAGLLTRLKNLATQVEKGEFLSDDQRKSFVNLAGKYMAGAEKQEKGVRADLGKVVKNYSLNPENVFGTRAETEETAVIAGNGGTAVVTINAQEEYDALPSGGQYIDPDDGKTYRKP